MDDLPPYEDEALVACYFRVYTTYDLARAPARDAPLKYSFLGAHSYVRGSKVVKTHAATVYLDRAPTVDIDKIRQYLQSTYSLNAQYVAVYEVARGEVVFHGRAKAWLVKGLSWNDKQAIDAAMWGEFMPVLTPSEFEKPAEYDWFIATWGRGSFGEINLSEVVVDHLQSRPHLWARGTIGDRLAAAVGHINQATIKNVLDELAAQSAHLCPKTSQYAWDRSLPERYCAISQAETNFLQKK